MTNREKPSYIMVKADEPSLEGILLGLRRLEAMRATVQIQTQAAQDERNRMSLDEIKQRLLQRGKHADKRLTNRSQREG